MNTLRTISRVFVIAAVVVGNISAVEGLMGKIDANRATIAAIMFETALPENADAAKAAVDTVGVALDLKSQLKDGDELNPKLLVANVVANFVTRKAVRCLDANGVNLDPMPKVGTAANHVVCPLKGGLKAAAPQMVAGLVVMGLTQAGCL